MKVTCYQCDTATDIDVNFEVVQFVCPGCKSVYLSNKEGDFVFRKQYSYRREYDGLKVGQKGTLKNVEYTITGIIVKNIPENFFWTEYILTDAAGNFRYLSEANGHWILLEETEDAHLASTKLKYITYNDVTYSLYESTSATIASAEGYFDFELPVKAIRMTEHIAPPYIISKENINSEKTVFTGEHISKSKIKKAFKADYVPATVGVGIVQPFVFNIRNLALILCSCMLLILLTHLFVYNDREENVVVSKDLHFSEFNNKEFISPSFTLKGGAAPLTVAVFSEVDNSWANVQVALVNEKTSEEIYANKDVEYYHGYTDGENWSEGDKSEDFSICGVSAGQYHLTITPQKAPEDNSNTYMRVTAVWNQASMWNVWVIVITIIVFLVIVYYLSVYFEKQRWAESVNSPYIND